MVIAASLVATLALIALTIRNWSDFGNQSRKLKAEVEKLKGRIEDHNEHLESGRTKLESINNDTEMLVRQRGRIEGTVLEQRAIVTGLEEKLARTKPQSHRVDKSASDDLFE